MCGQQQLDELSLLKRAARAVMAGASMGPFLASEVAKFCERAERPIIVGDTVRYTDGGKATYRVLANNDGMLWVVQSTYANTGLPVPQDKACYATIPRAKLERVNACV